MSQPTSFVCVYFSRVLHSRIMALVCVGVLQSVEWLVFDLGTQYARVQYAHVIY